MSDPNIKLLRAAKNLNVDEFRQAIENGADPQHTDNDGNNIFHFLGSGEDGPNTIRNFLDFITRMGHELPDINATNYDGYTPLNYAIASENSNVTRILLTYFRNIDSGIPDGDGNIALHYYMTIDWSDSVQEIFHNLIQHNSQRDGGVNHKNHLGQTAIYYAIDYGNDIGIQNLIDAGADLNLRDYTGKTPIEYAEYNERPDLVNIMRRSAQSVTREAPEQTDLIITDLIDGDDVESIGIQDVEREEHLINGDVESIRTQDTEDIPRILFGHEPDTEEEEEEEEFRRRRIEMEERLKKAKQDEQRVRQELRTRAMAARQQPSVQLDRRKIRQELELKYGPETARLVDLIMGDTETRESLNELIEEICEKLEVDREMLESTLNKFFENKRVSPGGRVQCRNPRSLYDLDTIMYLQDDDDLVVDNSGLCYTGEELKRSYDAVVGYEMPFRNPENTYFSDLGAFHLGKKVVNLRDAVWGSISPRNPWRRR